MGLHDAALQAEANLSEGVTDAEENVYVDGFNAAQASPQYQEILSEIRETHSCNGWNEARLEILAYIRYERMEKEGSLDPNL